MPTGNWWNTEWVHTPVANAVEVLGQEQVSVVTVRKVEQSQQVTKSLKRQVAGFRHHVATYKHRLATKRIQATLLRRTTRQQFDLLQECVGLCDATWEEILLEAIEQIPRLIQQL